MNSSLHGRSVTHLQPERSKPINHIDVCGSQKSKFFSRLLMKSKKVRNLNASNYWIESVLLNGERTLDNAIDCPHFLHVGFHRRLELRDLLDLYILFLEHLLVFLGQKLHFILMRTL